MTNLIVQPTRKAGLSLTPLIDVVFILLLFFMLTSSFSRERQLDLSAPVAATAPQSVEPARLLLKTDGSFVSLATDMALGSENLHEMGANKIAVLLHPEPAATVQVIVVGLEYLIAMGIERVSLGDTYPSGASQ